MRSETCVHNYTNERHMPTELTSVLHQTCSMRAAWTLGNICCISHGTKAWRFEEFRQKSCVQITDFSHVTITASSILSPPHVDDNNHTKAEMTAAQGWFLPWLACSCSRPTDACCHSFTIQKRQEHQSDKEQDTISKQIRVLCSMPDEWDGTEEQVLWDYTPDIKQHASDCVVL